MDKFKIGGKVYSKKGQLGEELGTVAVLQDDKVFVRLFENHFIQEFFPEELQNEQEYQEKFQEYINSIPKPPKFNI